MRTLLGDLTEEEVAEATSILVACLEEVRVPAMSVIIRCGKCGKILSGPVYNLEDWCLCPRVPTAQGHEQMFIPSPDTQVRIIPPQSRLDQLSLDAIRQIVREEVHAALHPPEQEPESESPFIVRESEN